MVFVHVQNRHDIMTIKPSFISSNVSIISKHSNVWFAKSTTSPRRFAVAQRVFNWFCKPHTESDSRITSSANLSMNVPTRCGGHFLWLNWENKTGINRHVTLLQTAWTSKGIRQVTAWSHFHFYYVLHTSDCMELSAVLRVVACFMQHPAFCVASKNFSNDSFISASVKFLASWMRLRTSGDASWSIKNSTSFFIPLKLFSSKYFCVNIRLFQFSILGLNEKVHGMFSVYSLTNINLFEATKVTHFLKQHNH